MALQAPGWCSVFHPRDWYPRVRAMLPEILRFFTIGGIATALDLGGAGLLHSKYQVAPLLAKAISVIVSTTFTYLGCRFWTFRHRENQPLRREAFLFIALNVAGLLAAEAVIALVTYVLGLRGMIAYNAASFVGTSVGTFWRFYAYRKWVFLAPAEAAASPGPAPLVLADLPPWEPDPAYLVAEAVVHPARIQPPPPAARQAS